MIKGYSYLIKEPVTILPLSCVCLFSLCAGSLLFGPPDPLSALLNPPSCLSRLMNMDSISGLSYSWLPVGFSQGRDLAEDKKERGKHTQVIYSPWLPF